MPFSFLSYDWVFDWVQSPTFRLVALLILNILWLPFVLWFIKDMWKSFKGITWGMNNAKRHFIMLAIDIPRDAEETPTSMEAIFSQLAGAHGSRTWWEEVWGGKSPESFSFEIVSIEGYVQYFIRCISPFRDLVEASVYAQYPNAEITEVRDYTQDVPSEYPNEEWDLWGTEYVLSDDDAVPLRTYKYFEDKIRGEFVDRKSVV